MDYSDNTTDYVSHHKGSHVIRIVTPRYCNLMEESKPAGKWMSTGRTTPSRSFAHVKCSTVYVQHIKERK